mmetsp:Transcript_31049/g.78579  ORF Transcript_31049/g.78579 Transcript_31049/m.78579 type:complete len:247 (+) Transcript_31049:63-803(+)
MLGVVSIVLLCALSPLGVSDGRDLHTQHLHVTSLFQVSAKVEHGQGRKTTADHVKVGDHVRRDESPNLQAEANESGKHGKPFDFPERRDGTTHEVTPPSMLWLKQLISHATLQWTDDGFSSAAMSQRSGPSFWVNLWFWIIVPMFFCCGCVSCLCCCGCCGFLGYQFYQVNGAGLKAIAAIADGLNELQETARGLGLPREEDETEEEWKVRKAMKLHGLLTKGLQSIGWQESDKGAQSRVTGQSQS